MSDAKSSALAGEVTLGVRGVGRAGTHVVEMLRDAGAEVEVTGALPSRDQRAVGVSV